MPPLSDLQKARRLRTRARRQAREQKRQARRVAELELELPNELERFLLEHVYWPHVDTLEPVSDLSAIQLDYLERRTALRWDSAGARQYGADVVAKPRRVRMTSLVLGAILYACMRWQGFRALTVLQVGRDDVLEPVHQQMAFAIHRLPAQWSRRWKRVGGRWRYEHSGGRSTWEPISAGYSERTADRRGRSGRIDLLHLSEAGYYPHPEPLWEACRQAVPQSSGWVIAESTLPPQREAWFARSFYATRQLEGVFLRAFFWPWHRDPNKRLARGTASYRAALAADVDPLDAEAEQELGLDTEQIAYRRWFRCRGTLDERRRAKRELPESPEEAHETAGVAWLEAASIERLERGCRAPIHRRRLGPSWSVSIWDDAPELLILGIDRASRDGRDYTAVVGIHPRTREQVCELHGRCTDAELAEGVEAVLRELVGLDKRRYAIAPERNRAKGAIAELVRKRLRVYKPRKSSLYGVTTSADSRPIILDRVAQAVEMDGIELRSSHLVGELKSMAVSDIGRVEGHPHDDLVFGLGMALYVAPRIPWPGGKGVWVPRRSVQPPLLPA